MMEDKKQKKEIPPRIQEEDEFSQDRGSLTPKQDAIAQKAKSERQGRFSKWPAIIKAQLIKVWIAGAACFFIIWSGFQMNADVLDSAAIVALAVGILIDFIAVPILEMTDGPKRDIHKYIMFNLNFKNKLVKYSLSAVLNFIYAFIICFTIMYLYQGINLLAINWGWVSDGEFFLRVEPILYGVFYILIDLFALFIRNVIKKIIVNNIRRK